MPNLRKYLHPAAANVHESTSISNPLLDVQVLRKNPGLFLRWELALNVISNYVSIPSKFVKFASRAWVEKVKFPFIFKLSYLILFTILKIISPKQKINK